MVARKLTNNDVISILSNYSDRSLLSKKCGNDLIRGLSFIPLSTVSKYKKFSNYSDLIQIGYETLWKAIMSFDIRKSDNFYYWAFLWIRQSVAKAALAEKQYFESFSCDGLDLNSEEFTEFETALLDAEELEVIRRSSLKLANTHQYVLTEVYKNDRSLRDIGVAMRLSHESVRKLRDDATRKLAMAVRAENSY